MYEAGKIQWLKLVRAAYVKLWLSKKPSLLKYIDKTCQNKPKKEIGWKPIHNIGSRACRGQNYLSGHPNLDKLSM
jgi:hypothetical protein